ncbi:MAG: hypothetical protein HKN21_00595 [Candidatus Eisenbacteria bacterium]|uniref:Transcription factor zinc-finger domain-containing protein n=1 Tax=Eiseniibacteriota bacterium TaxID=2212470 RepID=A0A7Y2E6D6_UNCEI|nr:hypothetical protein [Candidatus Eisenbacteria bacterium]
MKLVACAACHLQYDVTHASEETVSCACGEDISTKTPEAIDAKILRCGSCGAVVQDDAEDCAYCESVIVRDPKKLSLVCPECYARNAETSSYCGACGVKFQPQGFFGGDHPELDCPACEGQLVPQVIGGVIVRECDGCNGLWVPGDSFDDLVNRAIDARKNQGPQMSDGMRKKTPFQSKVVYRKCPECNLSMQRKNFARKSGIIVDWCGKHGTWLDADELEGIASFVLAGGLAKETSESPSVGWQQPADAKRMEAVYQSEKLMAKEKMRLIRQQERNENQFQVNVSGDMSLTGLLKWLLK